MISGGLWFDLLVPSCGSPPAAELIQLGLLGSIGNLPVSERVQLPHLSQLRLHHGRLGVHREGDWSGLQPQWAVLPDLLPAYCTRSCRDLEIQELLKSWALCGIGAEQVEDPWLPSSGFSEAEEREVGNLEM